MNMRALETLNKNEDSLPDFLSKLGISWWVEIITAKPNCIYYFGPFQNSKEAETAYPGYVEDLKSEAAQGIEVYIKRCKPDVLTVEDEEAKLS